MSLTSQIKEVKELFPNDDTAVRRFFGAALNAESQGDNEKASEYLDKAVAAEDKANAS